MASGATASESIVDEEDSGHETSSEGMSLLKQMCRDCCLLIGGGFQIGGGLKFGGGLQIVRELQIGGGFQIGGGLQIGGAAGRDLF